MSAIVAYEGPKVSLVFTDGASYDVEGRIMGLGRKVTVSKKVPLAIASRGNKEVGRRLAALILERVEADGFDRGMSALDADLPQFAETIEDAGRLFYTQVLIAGVSETHGVRNMFFQIPGSDTWPSGKLFHQPSFFTGLNCAEGLTLDQMGVRSIQPGDSFMGWMQHAGIAMMEYARRNPAEGSNFQGLFSSVGGQVDMTTVTPTGVEVETIHRWNDTVGELIDPTKDRPTAKIIPILAGMSRQQRRAAKAEARKGRRVA
jgi:hypothetical protein